MEHFDVTNAFTQADLDEYDIYVEPAKGYDKQRDKYGSFVYKLKKALYGTKQAARLWQTQLAKFLESIGFKRSTTDPCLFLYTDTADKIIICGIYVDDLIVAHNNMDLFKWFESRFCDTKNGGFNAKHLGPLHWFLGIAVDQSDAFAVSINQERYILNILKKYVPTYESTHKLRDHPRSELFSKLVKCTDDVERARVAQLPYMNIVGALLYTAVMTRPDIAYHTSMLSKFMSDPTMEAYELAVNLLLYLAYNPNIPIVYSGSREPPKARGVGDVDAIFKHAHSIRKNGGFVAYSDSSWGNKIPYPMFGFGIYLFGGLISFASKQLKVVAFSSCEAEYAAAAYTCKEITFIRNICRDMGFTLEGALVLLVLPPAKSTLRMAVNEV